MNAHRFRGVDGRPPVLRDLGVELFDKLGVADEKVKHLVRCLGAIHRLLPLTSPSSSSSYHKSIFVYIHSQPSMENTPDEPLLRPTLQHQMNNLYHLLGIKGLQFSLQNHDLAPASWTNTTGLTVNNLCINPSRYCTLRHFDNVQLDKIGETVTKVQLDLGLKVNQQDYASLISCDIATSNILTLRGTQPSLVPEHNTFQEHSPAQPEYHKVEFDGRFSHSGCIEIRPDHDQYNDGWINECRVQNADPDHNTTPDLSWLKMKGIDGHDAGHASRLEPGGFSS